MKSREELIAEAINTPEGRSMLFDAMKPGIRMFIDEHFSKWDKAHQKRYVNFIAGEQVV